MRVASRTGVITNIHTDCETQVFLGLVYRKEEDDDKYCRRKEGDEGVSDVEGEEDTEHDSG
jgi:hypothetical protein